MTELGEGKGFPWRGRSGSKSVSEPGPEPSS